jgi:hypothetical protein
MLEAIIRRLKHVKHDKRGVSNVIVVMLSLVLIVVIVANVVLWSYQMNQFDWERMQEKIEITNVTRETHSSWFVAHEEYQLNIGNRVNYTYINTHVADEKYERFTEAPGGWYNASWIYRKPIDINNTQNSNSLTDFQVLASIDTVSLITAGKMRSDCGDMRFADSDGLTLIDYWIESGTNSSDTKLWIKVPFIPANSTTIIYMYYGNPGATSVSNINNVFEATYTKINVAYEWETRISTTDVANGDDVGSWQDITFDFPFWREFKTRVYICSNGFGIFDPTASTNDYTNSLAELQGRWKIAPFWDDLRTDMDGGIVTNAGVYVDKYSDHFVITWETTRYGASGDSIKFQAILHRNGDVRFNVNNATNFNNFTPTLGISKGNSANYIDITNERATGKSWLFLLRKYTPNEPTCMVGSEETKGKYQFDIVGSFIVDLSAYPLGHIETVEIVLRYRAEDTYERWYMKAYNWTNDQYGNVGFNLTTGHMPTMGWDYYTVNLTTAWDSYVHNNGTLLVKLYDEVVDINQTTIDIDFFGIRAIIDGTTFDLKNSGATSIRIVSIWIINLIDHKRYDANFFMNSGENGVYTRADISLPTVGFIARVITERGNVAVFQND